MALKALATGSTAQGSISSAANISIFTHSSSTYAVVTKNQTDQGTGGFVILDISDPDNPTIVSEITDSTTGTNDDANNDWELLNGALDVETVIIGGVPYAVIAQRLDTASSAGGFTVVKLTDGSGNITSTSPTVIKQVQDGDAFAASKNAALGGLAGLSTQTIGSTTYLFTVGTSSTEGTVQVYDLQKLIANYDTALISQIEDDNDNFRIDNPTGIATNIVGGNVYAYATTERDTVTKLSYFEDLSFNPSTSSISEGTNTIASFDYETYGAPWDFFASEIITNDSKSFYLISEEKEGDSETHLYNFEVTNGSLTYKSNVKNTSPLVALDDVNQLASVEVNDNYYFIAPNSGSTNKGIEAIEVNMSSGALTPKGSIAIDGSTDIEGATFSSLDGATDFAQFSIGSSTYGLVTAKTDQAIQIVRLVHASSLSSATYDFSTGTLVVTGEDLLAKSGADNDIDVSQLTLIGEGSNTYALTSSDVEIDNATQFTVTLNAADRLQLAGLLNKDGTSSGGSTAYNIAVSSGWNPGNTWSPDDLTGNAITVSNVAVPTLTSASYDATDPTPTPTPTPTPEPTPDPTPVDPAPLGTNIQTNDDDGDGLKEVVTDDDGDLIDGNRDGIADAEQSGVVGLRMINDGADNTDYGALETDPALSFSAVSFLRPTEPVTDTTGSGSSPETYAVTTRDGRTQTTAIPSGIDNAFAGLLAFSVLGLSNGGSTTTTISLPQGLSNLNPAQLAYLRFNYSTNRFEDFVDASGSPHLFLPGQQRRRPTRFRCSPTHRR